MVNIMSVQPRGCMFKLPVSVFQSSQFMLNANRVPQSLLFTLNHISGYCFPSMEILWIHIISFGYLSLMFNIYLFVYKTPRSSPMFGDVYFMFACLPMINNYPVLSQLNCCLVLQELKEMKESITKSYLDQLKELQHMLDVKQKEVVEVNRVSAEQKHALEDLSERLSASRQSCIEANEIIKRWEIFVP